MTKTEMHALCTSRTLFVELTIEMFQPLHSFISSHTASHLNLFGGRAVELGVAFGHVAQ